MIDLRIIIKNYPHCLENRARLASILHDLYPKNNREVNLVLASYECGISDRISKLSRIDSMQMNVFITILEQEYGFQKEFATRSIEYWADGYSCTIGDLIDDPNEDMIPNCLDQTGVVYTISSNENGVAGLCRLITQPTEKSSEDDEDVPEVFQHAIQAAIAYFEKHCSDIIVYLGSKWIEKIGLDKLKEYIDAVAANFSFQHFIFNYYYTNDDGTPQQVTVGMLISIASFYMMKPVMPGLAVTGDMKSDGTIIKAENLTAVLQECQKRGAKTVLLPEISAADLPIVSDNLLSQLNLIFYLSPEEAIYKALRVE